MSRNDPLKKLETSARNLYEYLFAIDCALPCSLYEMLDGDYEKDWKEFQKAIKDLKEAKEPKGFEVFDKKTGKLVDLKRLSEMTDEEIVENREPVFYLDSKGKLTALYDVYEDLWVSDVAPPDHTGENFRLATTEFTELSLDEFEVKWK